MNLPKTGEVLPSCVTHTRVYKRCAQDRNTSPNLDFGCLRRDGSDAGVHILDGAVHEGDDLGRVFDQLVVQLGAEAVQVPAVHVKHALICRMHLRADKSPSEYSKVFSTIISSNGFMMDGLMPKASF